MSEQDKNILQRVLDWLRGGYPQGIPEHDYIALFGILHRSLTEQEVHDLAKELHEGEAGLDSSTPVEQIREVIRQSVHQEPSEEDVRRVAARLAEGGWPLVQGADLKQRQG